MTQGLLEISLCKNEVLVKGKISLQSLYVTVWVYIEDLFTSKVNLTAMFYDWNVYDYI